MWARYEVGDQVGPYIVEAVELKPIGETEWLEVMYNSGRGIQQIVHRLPTPPLEYELAPCEGETRVIIPYVPNFARGGDDYSERNPDTVAGAPENAEWISVEGSELNYWSLMKSAWKPTNDLFVIEHDVQSTQDRRDDIESCPELWCFHHYHHMDDAAHEAWFWGILGHTRFRKELIAKMPDLFTNLEDRWKVWTEMSTGVGKVLREAGFTPHEHLPKIIHHQMRGVGIR